MGPCDSPMGNAQRLTRVVDRSVLLVAELVIWLIGFAGGVRVFYQRTQE